MLRTGEDAKAINRERTRAYLASDAGKATRAAYIASPRYKELMRAYNSRPSVKEARSARNAKWRASKPGKSYLSEYQHTRKHVGATQLAQDKYVLKRYGLPIEAYACMLKSQNGVCAICGGVNRDNKRLSVDHDHETGQVRGLLCNTCNYTLGLVSDNLCQLMRLMDYLLAH